jgi:hypothetical protein
MENEHISSLFQRIRDKIAKHSIDMEMVSRVIFEETKISIKESDMKFKKHTLTLLVSPLKKGEIRMKKEKILERLREETGVKVEEIG